MSKFEKYINLSLVLIFFYQKKKKERKKRNTKKFVVLCVCVCVCSNFCFQSVKFFCFLLDKFHREHLGGAFFSLLFVVGVFSNQYF